MTAATCHDCRGRFDRDTMHLIKADTLSGRALICDPCHLDEVERITRFNREIRDRRLKAEAWEEGHSQGWSDAQEAHDVRQEMDRADWDLCTPNPYRKEADQ